MATKTKIKKKDSSGFDPSWITLINGVLEDRDSDIRISGLTDDFWNEHIGPMIDAIQDGGWPEMDGGGVLKG
jgi:hypothetical protein